MEPSTDTDILYFSIDQLFTIITVLIQIIFNFKQKCLVDKFIGSKILNTFIFIFFFFFVPNKY